MNLGLGIFFRAMCVRTWTTHATMKGKNTFLFFISILKSAVLALLPASHPYTSPMHTPGLIHIPTRNFIA